MTDAKTTRPRMRTWDHLAGQRRRPSEYEIVSTNMNHTTLDPDRPLEIGSHDPWSEWYKKYRNASPLRHPDWDAFRDPDEMVYRTYNMVQDGQESYVDGLLDEFNQQEHDAGLSDGWCHTLARLYTPGRFLVHTLQMASAYVMQFAPASTISHCFTFETADHLRGLSQISYRTRELSNHRPGFGFAERERALWEDDPAWQGFRELMEKVLVAYDWGESFVALQLVAKPAVDAAFLRGLGQAGRRQGDTLLGLLNDALLRDSERHRRWTGALVRFASDHGANRQVLDQWVDKWRPLGEKAIRAYLAPLEDEGAVDAVVSETDDIRHGLGL